MSSPVMLDKPSARKVFITHWQSCKTLVASVTAAEDDAARKQALDALKHGLVRCPLLYLIHFGPMLFLGLAGQHHDLHGTFLPWWLGAG